ncbi:MAG: aminoacyl-tRNA hydrolase [Gammaproteobacteria bacterium]
MASGITLIVGLGNPGAEYEHTRHNAGAWFVDKLVDQANTNLSLNKKFHGFHATTQLHGQDCHLLIPTTFMNLSGQAVNAVASYYKIAPDAILVAHDEIDLPVGDIRLKFDGGHGGHNGLRDIIRHLGTNKFYRLRIGVGHPGNSKLVHDYVLSPPKKTELSLIENALFEAERVTPLMLKGELQKAMQDLNTQKHD